MKISKSHHINKKGIVKQNPNYPYKKIPKEVAEDLWSEILEEQNLDSNLFYANMKQTNDNKFFEVYYKRKDRYIAFGDSINVKLLR